MNFIGRIASDNRCTVDNLVKNPKLLNELDLTPYVDKNVGLPTLTDIVLELEKPGRDPRATVEVMEFDDKVRDIKDLSIGMELNGIVNNITAFGCFVDLGLHENGLVHISQLCDRFVSNPAEVVSLHQHVRVKVIDIDYERGRIALTMKGIPQG